MALTIHIHRTRTTMSQAEEVLVHPIVAVAEMLRTVDVMTSKALILMIEIDNAEVSATLLSVRWDSDLRSLFGVGCYLLNYPLKDRTT